MKWNEYYEKVHQKELKGWNQIVRWIKQKKFFLLSVRLDKELVGNGYRLTVYLRER